MEENDSQYRSELKLWENDHGNIWLQVGYDDDDPCMTQGISLTKEDAHALINELQRILKNMEPVGTSVDGAKQLKMDLQA